MSLTDLDQNHFHFSSLDPNRDEIYKMVQEFEDPTTHEISIPKVKDRLNAVTKALSVKTAKSPKAGEEVKPKEEEKVKKKEPLTKEELRIRQSVYDAWKVDLYDILEKSKKPVTVMSFFQQFALNT